MKKQIIRSSISTTDPKIEDLKQRIRELASYIGDLQDEFFDKDEWGMLLDAHDKVMKALNAFTRKRRN